MFKLLLEVRDEKDVYAFHPLLWDTVPRVGDQFPIVLDDEFDFGFEVRIIAHRPDLGYIIVNLGELGAEDPTIPRLLEWGWLSATREAVWKLLPFQKSCVYTPEA